MYNASHARRMPCAVGQPQHVSLSFRPPGQLALIWEQAARARMKRYAPPPPEPEETENGPATGVHTIPEAEPRVSGLTAESAVEPTPMFRERHSDIPEPIPLPRRPGNVERGRMEQGRIDPELLSGLNARIKDRSIRVPNKLLGRFVREILGWDMSLRAYLDMRARRSVRESVTIQALRELERAALILRVNTLLASADGCWLDEPLRRGFYVRMILIDGRKWFFSIHPWRANVVSFYTERDFRRATSHTAARGRQYADLGRNRCRRQRYYC